MSDIPFACHKFLRTLSEPGACATPDTLPNPPSRVYKQRVGGGREVGRNRGENDNDFAGKPIAQVRAFAEIFDAARVQMMPLEVINVRLHDLPHAPEIKDV